MNTRFRTEKGFAEFPIFEVEVIRKDKGNKREFYPFFGTDIYLIERTNEKNRFYLAALTKEMQDAAIKTYGKDSFFLKTLQEVDEVLKQIIITLNYTKEFAENLFEVAHD